MFNNISFKPRMARVLLKFKNRKRLRAKPPPSSGHVEKGFLWSFPFKRFKIIFKHG